MAFISSTKTSNGKEEVNTASFSTAITQVSFASADVATASFSHDTVCAYIASQFNDSQTWKKITIQGIDVAGFDKSKVECFNCHKMGHFARECRAPRSQDRGRRENFKQGSKIEKQTPKALMAIDRVGWDWSYMVNEVENHALVADEEAPIEFALMAKSSSENKIRGLEFKVESKDNTIERLTKELEEIKKEKEGLDSKLTGFQSASKDLDTLLGSQRSDKNKEGLGYSTVPPPPAQVYSPPKKDISWTELPEFADDTITDYSRPSPSIESNSSDLQSSDSFVSEKGDSLESIMSKPIIKFVKSTNSPTEVKISKVETVRKPSVKYAKMYRNTTKSPKFDHLAYDCGIWVKQGKTREKNNYTHKSRKFPTGNSKISTADLGNKGKAVKAQLVGFGDLNRTLLTMGNSQNVIDDKGYWDSNCSRHMTGNISYLSNYEPYDGGYVSFGQGGGKITGKGIIKTECIVLGRDFKLKDDTNVFLRTPRQHNMYSINLNNIVPHKDLTCLVVKASTDECMLWHRRLGHLNFKTMNKLVRHNLVKGLPSKCFENDHTCVACLKGKQHKASCKTKLVHSVSKPLHTFHMDLFGPTSVSSLNHKLYCLVVTDDFSRFTWTFFLKTKDETSGILRNFITEIENLKELKVKILRCDNGGKFRNKEMNYFCSRKGIKREFNNARTPQQNGVAKRRNKTLIEAARTMLADAKLHVTFWAEAVNTACYVQNRVLVKKSQNKTPYELFNGRTPVIRFLKPFGRHVMILNTLDNLGKFDAKGDEGTKDVASQDVKKDVSSLRYIPLPNWFHEAHLESSTSNAQDACNADAPESSGNSNPTTTSTNPSTDHIETLTVESLIPTVSSSIPTTYLDDSPEPSIYQMDMKSAFLYGTIDEEVYMMQPPGFQDLEFPAKVYKVEKTMYGLHQAPRAWSANTPMNKENPWGKDRTGKDVDLHLYRSMSGSLIYLTASKPDIMFAVCACARHQVTPKECHLHAVKRIFRYLKGHPKLGLWYPKESSFDLVAYSDSDYGGATQDRKSTIGGCQFFEKYEHNVDFHQIEDFVEASHIRIETIDEGTKILATMDGKPRTIFESSIRRNLKLNDEVGISSLPDAELFENLALMGYNILPNQRTVPLFDSMLVHQGEGLGTPTEPHHTPSPEAQQSSPTAPLSPSLLPTTTEKILTVIPTDIPTLRQYSRRARIAQSSPLSIAADEPASPLGVDSQGEAFPTVSGLEAEQDKENIIKTSALPYDSPPRVTSLAADEGTQELEITSLKAKIKLLENKDREGAEPSGEDAIIKGRSLETGEEAGVEKSTERGSNDTEELVNVLTSLDAASILTSRVQVVSVPPAPEVATVSIPTGRGMVPTASPIFTTASVVTPYSRRKGKEKMVESDTPKKKKLQEQIDIQMAREMEEQMAREDQRRSEHIARDEYEQITADLSIGEKIDMINELVKHQDHYAKVLKYQAQQSKPLSKKQQIEFYMSVLKSHLGWKTKPFKGMSLEKIREKFILVWKQIEDFVPMASKEERKRVKRKGLRLEQKSAKKMKTSEEVSEEDLKEMMQLVPVEEVYVEALQVKHPIIDWEIYSEGQRNYWNIIRLGGHTAIYQFFVDMLKHFDREDLTQLWTLVRETLSIRRATSDKEKELGKAFDSGNLIVDEALSLGEDCWE
uniref:Ribonuclease H-like domain-containing protein n=1 Tax=Tanacetum cinerariifolium TaxID=118510 RepID=A0A6L2KK05_TANCI|nr:ribonuclease H-like domain-containing protein [Tanacetum cinerariifolium]